MNKKIIVLYKKTGETPTIKFITDIFSIKQMIVKGNLDMIRYENYIIVCNAKSQNGNKLPNIVLDFNNISGDFFLIGYNSKNKDFRSLTRTEICFYQEVLERKAFQYETYKNWLEKCTINMESSQITNDFKEYQTFQRNLSQRLNNKFENNQSFQTISPTFPSNKMLEMILNIQAIILKSIKNMN